MSFFTDYYIEPVEPNVSSVVNYKDKRAKKDEKQPVKVESTEQQWIRNLKACRVCRCSDVSAQRAVCCMVAVAMLTT